MPLDRYYNDYVWEIRFISEEANRNAGYEREIWINAETGETLNYGTLVSQ